MFRSSRARCKLFSIAIIQARRQSGQNLIKIVRREVWGEGGGGNVKRNKLVSAH